MGGFWNWLGGSEEKFKTNTFVDEQKTAVASPLSKYLASQTGEGVARYDERVTSDYTDEQKASANEFMGIDAHDYFEKNIKAPAVSLFEEQFDIGTEDFAGRLSGSGRFRDAETRASTFSKELAGTQAEFEMGMPKAQFEMATAMKQEEDKEAVAQYQDWLKSLPQYNPVLDKALAFLQEGTSTGTTVASYIKAGTGGLIGNLLGAIGGFLGSGGGRGGGTSGSDSASTA